MQTDSTPTTVPDPAEGETGGHADEGKPRRTFADVGRISLTMPPLGADRRPLRDSMEEWAVATLKAAGLPVEPGCYDLLHDGTFHPSMSANERPDLWKETLRLNSLAQEMGADQLTVLAAQFLESADNLDRIGARVRDRFDAWDDPDLSSLLRANGKVAAIITEIRLTREREATDRVGEAVRAGGRMGAALRAKSEKHANWWSLNQRLEAQGVKSAQERIEQIAGRAGVSENTVKSALYRMRKHHPMPNDRPGKRGRPRKV